MLAGHYAPALALRRSAPTLPLWALFIAVQFVDILFSLFVLLGIEELAITPGITESNPLDLRYLPFSHSVVATVVWSVVVAVGWHAYRRKEPAARREALVMGAAVASHFVLDLIVHIPDLPIAGGHGDKIGLGLWNHMPAALSLELGLIVAAAWWAGSVAAIPKRWKIVAGVLVLLGVTGYFAPAPDAPNAVAILGLAMYLGLARLAGWAGAVGAGRGRA